MLHKKHIIQSFNQAAQNYDAVATLQRNVAFDLLTRIDIDFNSMADLGCGTGFFTQQLALQFPKAAILGIDFAEKMLQHAQIKRAEKNIQWLCADAEYLPLSAACTDVVVSNLMLQWSCNLEHCLSEIYRILKPGGHLFFSSFAPGSLHELAAAWQKVDNTPHIHTFTPAATFTHQFEKLRMTAINMTQKSYTVYYPNALSLMHTLKTLGASNHSIERTQGLTPPKKLLAAIEAYENIPHAENKLPATYEIYFGVIKK